MDMGDMLRYSVVKVQGILTGSGFFIDHEGSILTCHHVVAAQGVAVSSNKNISVVFDGTTYTAECIFISPEPAIWDVAVLRLVGRRLPQRATLLPIGVYRENSSSRMFRTFGYRPAGNLEGLPAGGELRGRTRLKSSIDLLQLQSQALGSQEIRHGMSGAPVYDETTQQIVGMITTLFRDSDERIPLALPIEEIGAIWYTVKKRLYEEQILTQLHEILAKMNEMGAEYLHGFYTVLQSSQKEPLVDARAVESLDAFIAHIRSSGRMRDIITYIISRNKDYPWKQKLFNSQGRLTNPAPLSKIEFINRVDEIYNACKIYAPMSILFEAPAGYGKTEILHAVDWEQFRDAWCCVYVEVGGNQANLQQLIAQISQQAEVSVSLSPDLDITVAGEYIGVALAKKTERFNYCGVVLLVDRIEQLSDEDATLFWSAFLPTVRQMFNQITKDKKNLQIRMAGRYIGPRTWVKHAGSLLKVEELSPFEYRAILDTVEKYCPGEKADKDQDDLRRHAAHLMHITHGHPGCIAHILRHMDFDYPDGADAYYKNNAPVFREVVTSVTKGILRSIPDSLREIFYRLSVFRRYNLHTLQQIINQGIITYPHSAQLLERALTATYLVRRRNNFIQDDIVRGLLAIHMRWEDPAGFLQLCEKSQQLYMSVLQQAKSTNLEGVAAEALFQELRIRYYGGGETDETRQRLREDFFAPEGILYRYVNTLASKDNGPDLIADLLAFLEQKEQKDWELQFAVNFFMREDTYSDLPYSQMVNYVQRWWAGLVGQQV